jgi:hypothetical protein
MGLAPDDHDPDDMSEGSYCDIRFVFHETHDEDGENSHRVAEVHVHSHHVNDAALVDALLMLAHQAVARGMNDTMFNEAVPQEVRDFAAAELSKKWLGERIQSGIFEASEAYSLHVPDDLSELLEE